MGGRGRRIRYSKSRSSIATQRIGGHLDIYKTLSHRTNKIIKKKKWRGLEHSPVVECLPSKHWALGSIHSASKAADYWHTSVIPGSQVQGHLLLCTDLKANLQPRFSSLPSAWVPGLLCLSLLPRWILLLGQGMVTLGCSWGLVFSCGCQEHACEDLFEGQVPCVDTAWWSSVCLGILI